jgi:xanthine dehydrogenase YagS FAD-binding subunit
VAAQSLEEAVALLAEEPGAAAPIAGGTDLISEIKEGTAKPRRLVGLSQIGHLHGIKESPDWLSIGAMTTISQVAAHPAILTHFPALSDAAASLATPQIRNVGTVGGNLAQRPRCWYYRHPLTVCLKKGGVRCYALGAETKYLCITGGDRCYIVHPSDTAVALVAFNASLDLYGPSGSRTIPIEQFFAGPGRDPTRENILEPGELVTRVHLLWPGAPGQEEGRQVSRYLKARERETGDFALASVAASLELGDQTVAKAAVVLGGVAPVPYRARRVEEYLLSTPRDQIDPSYAGGLALPDARPLGGNRYKAVLAANLVKRAIAGLLGRPGA